MSIEDDDNAALSAPPPLPVRPAAGIRRLRTLLQELEASSCPDPIYTELTAQWHAAGRETPGRTAHTVLARRYGPPLLGWREPKPAAEEAAD
ncbi:hypothetical protein [Streptomyces sp. ODS05-4]|uniref:hypothetical protein n=1 Tax=Streptomyces sp. ODS05-4 TaxID=2944939 RepID=UPI00210D64AC|nr:hypothetical protein [Streptomyces sp. ODS05-4]